MKKLFKKLILLIIPLLLFTSNSYADYDPILIQPLLGSDYYTITNDSFASGTIKSDIQFIEKFSGEGTETIIDKVQYSVKSTGVYNPGQLSWKTSRMFIAVTFFDPVTKKVTSIGYQFKPTELITANNTVTTVTISKDQAVSGIIKGMNAANDAKYANPTDREALKKAIEYGFENGCGLRVNAEIAKFIVPAGINTNRALLADESNIVGERIMVRDFNSSLQSDRDRLYNWARSNPYPFSNPTGFVNDAITRAKGSTGDETLCSFKAELAMADTLFQADKTSFTDGTGTLRDRLEIYDMKNNLVIGDSLSTGEKYKMCSYVLNMGSVDTSRPVNADFYMVTEDIRNMSLPNHLKTALGSSSPNQPDVKAFLPVNRMATYCKEFETPSVGRELRLESQIPDSYIPDDDTKATNNIAIRIMQLAPQDLAYSDISSVGDLKPNTSNTFKVVMCKVEGTEKVEAMYTRIWAKDKNGNIIRDSVSKGSNSLNKPGDCTEYNVPINIPGNEITVCARVDERHATNGENYDLSNDEGCRTFAAERDFFVSNFEISPSSIILDPIKVDKDGKAGPAKSYSGNFTFSYDVNLEEGKDDTSYTVDAVLRDYNGSELNRQSITLKQGESKKVTFSRNYTFAPGKYNFEARVNLDPKKVQEYSKVLADPYQNNKQAREISIRNDFQPNKTTTCNTQLTDLQEDYPDVNGIATHKGWTTTYHIVEKYGHEEERERCETTCTGEGEDRECDRDCWTYTVCVTDNIVEWDESIGHSQEFKIEKVEFRSKMTKDEYIKKNNIKSNTVKENEGWVDITNATGEIRAGYGYELRVTVKYKDNLADTCSCGPVYCSWSSGCDSGKASPGIPGRGPKPKGSLYITFPGEDQVEVREFKETTACSNNPNKEFTRVYTFDGSNINGTGVNKKRFVDENIKTGTVLGIKITTSATPGAQPGPDEIPKTVLCDEKTFNFEVKGNFAQDFITQIVQ